MSQETITYLTNIVIVTILACLITHYWIRQGKSEATRWWVIAAWIFTVTDILFAARPWLAEPVSRILPTLLVTVGHAALFFGARKCAELDLWQRRVAVVVFVHAAVLITLFYFDPRSDWRKVINGLAWGGLSIASYWSLRKAPDVFWKSPVAPANVFLYHGVFHGGRLGLASLFAVQSWEGASDWLQIIGDLEVSFFMVALFVGILVANLQLRNAELEKALDDVKTLSGLLPICAWCKKVRDDDGYWKRVEDYFSAHSHIKFTHGICQDCLTDLHPKRGKRPTT